MDQPKIERMLRLMKMMSGNMNYSINELARKLDMSYRTIYRYIDTFKAAGLNAGSLKLQDINIRDPFNLVDKGVYYMYASSTVDGIGGVGVYTSRDLDSWEPLRQVMTLLEGNWSTGPVWAPEVHKYRGKYYLFATINSPVEWKQSREDWVKFTHRGTRIFKSDSPLGPFRAISETQQTPLDYMALVGTLYVEDGRPYMVFCHEWVETVDGTVEYVELGKDLSKAVSRPVSMFCGSPDASTASGRSLSWRGGSVVLQSRHTPWTRSGAFSSTAPTARRR